MTHLKLLTNRVTRHTYFNKLPIEILVYIEEILCEIEFNFMRSFFKLKPIPSDVFIHKDFISD
jgi:hypothetical protein